MSMLGAGGSVPPHSYSRGMSIERLRGEAGTLGMVALGLVIALLI